MIFKKALNLIPTFGCLIFFVLFFWAAWLYPGGSQADLNSIGFSWKHNYWCNLLYEKAMNGMENGARPFAIAAMGILCFSIAFFFVQFANILVKSILWKNIVKICGILSMVFVALMSTDYHDQMTTASSIFGLFAIIGIIRTVHQSNFQIFKWGGLLCILLLALNNVIYYSGFLIAWLPLIQKFTFLLVLMWIIGLNGTLSVRNNLKSF